MSTLEFNEEKVVRYQKREKGMDSLLVRWGVARNVQEAQKVLLAIALAAIAIAGAVLFFSGRKNDNNVPQEQIDSAFDVPRR